MITLQTVTSLQNLINEHILEVPPVFNGLMEVIFLISALLCFF